MNNPYLDLFCPQSLQRSPYGLKAALDIGLEDDVEFLYLAGAYLVIEVAEAYRFVRGGFLFLL